MESRNHLEMCKMNAPLLLRSLETAIRLGRPLLIEDCSEALLPVLEPVLAKAVFRVGPRQLIHVGDKDVDYDPEFRLYMATSMANPHFLPEVAVQVNVINFTVTRWGLEEQLLSDVVSRETPDIEAKKNRLLVTLAADKKQLMVRVDSVSRVHPSARVSLR
jgi:dynein heavy chain